jgi:hypothetical protein
MSRFSPRLSRFSPVFPTRVRETVRALPKPEKDPIRDQIERRIAEFLSRELGATVDSDFVIVHAYDIKSARETSSNDEEGILVRHSPTPRAFIEVSTLFKSINAAYTDKWVEVYAPVVWSNRDQRDEIRGRWKEPIKGMITDVCLAERRT